MSENIIAELISSGGTVLVALIAIISNNRVIKVKLEELEKKQDKHNQVIERTYKLESDMATAWKRYDEMAERIERVESRQFKEV